MKAPATATATFTATSETGTRALDQSDVPPPGSRTRRKCVRSCIGFASSARMDGQHQLGRVREGSTLFTGGGVASTEAPPVIRAASFAQSSTIARSSMLSHGFSARR